MVDANADPVDLNTLIEEGKNKQTVFCVKCPSKILCRGVGVYEEIKFTLPNVGPKRKAVEDDKEPDEEELKDYWKVENMYHFENIGFSNTVDGRKYLICADCEMGPIGWQDLQTQASYLAVRRVKYSD